MGKQTDRQADRQRDRKKDQQVDRQVDRQADRQTGRHSVCLPAESMSKCIKQLSSVCEENVDDLSNYRSIQKCVCVCVCVSERCQTYEENNSFNVDRNEAMPDMYIRIYVRAHIYIYIYIYICGCMCVVSMHVHMCYTLLDE